MRVHCEGQTRPRSLGSGSQGRGERPATASWPDPCSVALGLGLHWLAGQSPVLFLGLSVPLQLLPSSCSTAASRRPPPLSLPHRYPSR